MLTLLEPCVTKHLLDRPDLGCAMLISVCQQEGIKTTLIKGQTRYIKDMFLNDSEEIWSLIQNLKENSLKEIGISKYRKSIQGKSIKQFQGELRTLYEYVIIDKNQRHYLNGIMIEKFNNLVTIFSSVYLYYLAKLNYSKLKIIDNYVYEIIKSNPRYIGVSLQGSFELLSRTIRRRLKELTTAPIIVGGVLTPFIDLKKIDKIFEEEYFDYLIVGAGEHALPSLIEELDNKHIPVGIPNVIYKQNGKIKINSLEVINELDKLPYPDYSQFDLDLYLTPKRILPLQTARGCTWRNCVFCSHHNIDLGNYKTFSIRRVIEVIKYLRKTYNCYHFAFHDEELPPSRAKRISEAILNNNLGNISINTYARPIGGYTNNLLGLMRKAGFTLIHWGVESGCQRILNLMNKGTEESTIGKILKNSSNNKIANLCFLIFGFPGETEKEALQTIEFLKEHAAYIEDILFGFFGLSLNSPMGKRPEKWSVYIESDNSNLTKGWIIPEKVGTLWSRFIKEIEINSIRITSDKLRYLPPGLNLRMLHFLNSSYQLLLNSMLLEFLKEGRLDSIFPIVLGEVKKKRNKTIFYPINTKETVWINRNLAPKEIILDAIKEKIYILSDGTLSIESIILVIYDDFKMKYTKRYICMQCIKFFENMFSKNFALGFAKSWQST